MAARLSSRIALAAGLAAACLCGCGGSNPAAEDQPPSVDGGPTQLRFHNLMEQHQLAGAVRYRVRNLSALDTVWSGEVAYGEYSAYRTVSARSVDFTVTGQVRGESGGQWQDIQWTTSVDMVEGGKHTAELTFGN